MLVHTFSNQKVLPAGPSHYLCQSVSVTVLGCKIRLFDLPHEYDSSINGLFAKASDLGSIYFFHPIGFSW